MLDAEVTVSSISCVDELQSGSVQLLADVQPKQNSHPKLNILNLPWEAWFTCSGQNEQPEGTGEWHTSEFNSSWSLDCTPHLSMAFVEFEDRQKRHFVHEA